MKKLLLTGALLLLGSVCSAQTIVTDKGHLRKVVNDPDYYRSITVRFVSADQTLSLQELADLYYGFALTTNYDTGGFPEYEVKALFEAEEYDSIQQMCSDILSRNPTSLRALKWYLSAGHESGDLELGGYLYRFFALLEVIGASGDGSRQNPFMVTQIEDEYEVMNYVVGAVTILSHELVERNYDTFRILVTEDTEDTIWFDVSLYMDKFFTVTTPTPAPERKGRRSLKKRGRQQ